MHKRSSYVGLSRGLAYSQAQEGGVG